MAADVSLKLVVIRGGAGLKQEYPLTQQVITIGRSLNNLIVLQDNKVSRYHCEIIRQDNDFIVKDLDSANGIKVNGSRVVSKPLEPRDVVTVGDTEFRVEQTVLATRTPLIDPASTIPANKDVGDVAPPDEMPLFSMADSDAPSFLTGSDLDSADEKISDIATSAGGIPGRTTGGGGAESKFSLSGLIESQTPALRMPPMSQARQLREDRLSRPPSGLFESANRPSFDELSPDRKSPGIIDAGLHKLLEPVNVPRGSAAIGGMTNLTGWLARRAKASAAAAKNLKLPKPSALTVVGGPGCGKTLTTLFIASQWGMNFFKLHMPYLLFSPPEKWLEMTSDALGQVMAYNPALLAIEDVDLMANRVEAMGDTIKRSYLMVMEVITHWVRNKEASPFTVITGTYPRLMHPELLRKGGSLDEVFYIELPQNWERLEILEVLITQTGRVPSHFDLKQLAEASDGFAGGQIHEGITSAFYEALNESREPTTYDVRVAFSKIVPIVHTYGKHLEEMRHWGRLAAKSASLAPEEVKIARGQAAAPGPGQGAQKNTVMKSMGPPGVPAAPPVVKKQA